MATRPKVKGKNTMLILFYFKYFAKAMTLINNYIIILLFSGFHFFHTTITARD
jgi:hypothetical protein